MYGVTQHKSMNFWFNSGGKPEASCVSFDAFVLGVSDKLCFSLNIFKYEGISVFTQFVVSTCVMWHDSLKIVVFPP